jgi:hypothetical protein
MATQDYAASIQGVSIRVTRLDAAGNLLTGAGDSYTTSAFMRVSFTPEYEEGDEITEKNANGVVCVTYKSPDTLKRITMELAICEPDPELSNLISGGLLLRKDVNNVSKSIGWAAPAVGDDPAGFGVAIEAWSHAIRDGKKATTLPYFHWVFPYAKLRQSGDRVIENGMLATTFEGYGLGNSLFASGPDMRWEFPVAAERPYSYARTDWAPVGLKGFYTWNSGLVAAVSNKALTNNVATLTTSAAHGFVQGDSVLVEDVDATFNGTYTVASAPTTVTFTYAKTASNVVSAAVSPAGEATVANPINEPAAAGSYTEVTSAALEAVSGATTGGYNVPGNKDFNPDNAIDRIIVSNEDLSA